MALAGLIIVVALAWSLYGWQMLASAGRFLVLDEPAVPSDVIVATYSSSIIPGADKVVGLYQEGLSKSVLLSSFQVNLAGIEYSESAPLVRRYLVARGIPETSIYRINSLPTSEKEESQAIRRAFEANGWRSGLVVVVDYRSSRTMLTIQAEFESTGVRLTPQTFQAPGVDLERWWESRIGVSVMMNEYPRLVYYLVRGRF